MREPFAQTIRRLEWRGEARWGVVGRGGVGRGLRQRGWNRKRTPAVTNSSIRSPSPVRKWRSQQQTARRAVRCDVAGGVPLLKPASGTYCSMWLALTRHTQKIEFLDGVHYSQPKDEIRNVFNIFKCRMFTHC